MKTTLVLLGVILAVAMLGSSAMSAQDVQTKSFTGIPNLSSDLLFNKFDPTKGTLTSIEVILSLSTSGGRLVLNNDGQEPAAGFWELGANGAIISADVPLINGALQPLIPTVTSITTGTFSLAGNPNPIQGDYDPTPPCGGEFLGTNANDLKSGFVSNTVFGAYTGAGTYSITADISQWSSYGSIGGIEYAVTPVQADGFVRVIYNYEPVPEPGSIMGLLTGLGALGFSIRRRR